MSIQKILSGVVSQFLTPPQQAVDVSFLDNTPRSSIGNANLGNSFKEYNNGFAVLSVLNRLDRSILFSTDKFRLLSFTEDRVERAAPMFSFGESSTFTSGSKGYFFSYVGIVFLAETSSDNSRSILSSYNQLLRVHTNVQNKKDLLCTLTFRNLSREGYITQFSQSKDGAQPNKADIGFSMFIIKESAE